MIRSNRHIWVICDKINVISCGNKMRVSIKWSATTG